MPCPSAMLGKAMSIVGFVPTTASLSPHVKAALGPDFFEPIILAECAGQAFLQRSSDWSSIEK
jgi:hypothetical protein